VLNNISKFFSSRQLTLPIIGLLFIVGVVSEQTNPVLSKPIREIPTSAAFNPSSPRETSRQQKSSDNSLLSRLREIREQRSQQRTAAVDSEGVDNSLLSRLRAVREQRSQQRTAAFDNEGVKLVTSTNFSQQKATREAGVMSQRNIPTRDGVYLYGQSARPNQLGQGYIIFQKQQGRVTGALYMPRSEFSCFQGTINKSGELAMTVSNSIDEVGSSQIATGNTTPSLTDDQFINSAYSVVLQDYHPIQSISANDRRILRTCQNNS
jgi:hypothetical protein